MNELTKIFSKYAFFICLVISIYGCSSSKSMEPVTVAQSVAEEESIMNLPLSTISISYKISKSALNEQLNNYLDSIFSESWEFPDQDIVVHLNRMKSSEVNLQDKRILIKLPLHIDLDKSTLLGTWSAYGELMITILSEIDINEDWALSCVTDIIDYEWIVAPQIKIGIFDVPIERLTKGITNHIKPILENNIDQTLREHFDLAQKVATTLSPLLSPYQLDSTVGGWIQMTADSFHMSTWQNEESLISGKIYAPFSTQVTSLEPTHRDVELPPFTWNNQIGDISNINLGVDVSYDYLTTLARQQFLNKSFKNGKREVKVTDLTIYGEIDRLGVIATTTGSFNGTIRLEGRPVYHKGKLYCKDITWDINTKNLLHKTGVWLKKGFIHDQLNEMLTFDLNPYVLRAQGEIQKTLTGIKDERDTDISIDWGQYDITDINCNPDKLTGLLTIDMQIQLIVSELSKILSD